MLLEALRTYWLAKPAVIAAIQDRLFPDAVDQNEYRNSADMRIVRTGHEGTLAGLAGLAKSYVTVDCYSERRVDTHVIAAAFMYSGITKFRGLVAGTNIQGAQIVRGPDDFDDGVLPGTDKRRYGTSVSFEVHWAEQCD